MSFFFEDMDDATDALSPRNLGSEEAPKIEHNEIADEGRQALELMRAFYKIPDYAVRGRICDLAKSLAPHDSEKH